MAGSSAVGSEVFAILALLTISLVTVLILRHYLPLRTTPAYILVPIFLALSLPTSIVLLVPIDLASNAVSDDATSRGVWLPDRVLLVSWRISYWLTFALTWFLLPILAEYSDAGYREPKARLIYSLRQNAQYYALMFGAGLLGMIYFFVSYGISPTSFKGPVMALAYCWGLVFAIYLMGHGLVTIPRRLIRNASVSGRLRRIQSAAPKMHEKMEEALQRLDRLEAEVAELGQRKTGTARLFHEWIEELADQSGIPESRAPPATLSRRASALPSPPTVPAVITEGYVAHLARNLDRARHSRIRHVDGWDRLVQDAVDTQAILDSAASKQLEIGRSSPRASVLERLTLFTPYTRYVYYWVVAPYVKLFLGGILGLASVCVVWSEVIKIPNPDLSIISLTVVHHARGDRGQIGFSGQVIAAFWILYMCTAALASLTEVKVWRGRALVRRNTAYESAFWYSMQVAKLSVPLSYNFMTFLAPQIYKETTFYQFLGILIDLTAASSWFDYAFPIFILFPVCATLFGLYGKAKRLVGYGDFVDDDEDEENVSGYGTGGWREGRELIERETNGHASLAGLRGSGEQQSNPRLHVPNNLNNSRSPPTVAAPAEARAQRANTTPARSSLDPQRQEVQPEDENFIEAFGHRVRNTLDTVQKPKWLQSMEDGIKKPKWMGSSSSGDDQPSRSGTDFTRWLGGGNQDGRVRL